MKKSTKTGKFSWVTDLVVMLLIFLVSQLVVSLIVRAFGLSMPAVSAIDKVPIDVYMSEQEALARWNSVLYSVSMLLPIVLMWIYARLRGGKGSMRIRCSIAGLNPATILIGLVWLLSSQIVIEPLALMLPKYSMPGVGLGVWAYVTAIAFAPILEEILCRGVWYETFHKRLGIKWSILISALFFGLIHGDPATMVVATVAGMIFGVLYVRTSSIFASMIVHAINNALAFTLTVCGKSEVSLREMIGNDEIYYIVYGVAVLIFLAASVEAFFKLAKVGKAEKQLKTEGDEGVAEVSVADVTEPIEEIVAVEDADKSEEI